MAQKTDPFEIAKWGALFAGGFLVYKLFKGIGLIQDKQDKKTETTNETIQDKDWTKPTFWKKASPTGFEVMAFTKASTDTLIKKIYDSHGTFNDNEEQMQGVFRQFNYKSQYSYIADKFFIRYNEDLTTWLKNYFSAEELYPVWSHLESLPTYKKIKK